MQALGVSRENPVRDTMWENGSESSRICQLNLLDCSRPNHTGLRIELVNDYSERIAI